MSAPRKVRKGDRVVYAGKYAWEMPEVFGEVEWFEPYPPGTVIRFKHNRFHGRSVVVELDGMKPEYADWPVKDIAPAPGETWILRKDES